MTRPAALRTLLVPLEIAAFVAFVALAVVSFLFAGAQGLESLQWLRER